MFNLNNFKKKANIDGEEIIVNFDEQELASLFSLSSDELDFIYSKITSEGEDILGVMQDIVYLCDDCYSVEELTPQEIGYIYDDEAEESDFNNFFYISREDKKEKTLTCTSIGKTITYDIENANNTIEYLNNLAERYNVEHNLDEEGKKDRWNKMSLEQQKREMDRKRYFSEE